MRQRGHVYVLQGLRYNTQYQVTDNRCSSKSCYRWGDYTSLLIYPNNSATMWASSSYAPMPTSWGPR